MDDKLSSQQTTPQIESLLKDGSYYIRYTPVEIPDDILFYEGTMRVMRVKVDDEKDDKKDHRIEIKAGGDLYCRWRRHPFGRNPEVDAKMRKDPLSDPASIPDLEKGIPVFPRKDYKYYLEVIKLLEAVDNEKGTDPGFTARFKIHEYDRGTKWPNPGTRTVLMKRDCPTKKKSKGSSRKVNRSPERTSFSGKLMDEESGQVVGKITMEYVSPHLRQAHILVDRLDTLKFPASAAEWKEAFSEAKWDVKVTERVVNIKDAPADGLWTVADLHHAMLLAKDSCRADKEKGASSPRKSVSLWMEDKASTPEEFDTLDEEWFYHLFCVPRIKDFDRGVMYDTYGTDSNNIPREGAAIACLWEFDKDEPGTENRWGEAKGPLQAPGNEGVFKRIAVHEVGHAMGLSHNLKDNGFMNTTDAIADSGLAEHKKKKVEAVEAGEKAEQEALNILVAEFAKKPDLADSAKKRREAAVEKGNLAVDDAKKVIFPKNISQKFHKNDLERLQFGPDVTVRPGGEFDDGGPYFDQKVEPADGLSLRASPLLETVPLGAPVRIQFALKNISDKLKSIPGDLTLSSGCVSGYVVDPNGVRRTFWPIKKCVDVHAEAQIKPNKTAHSAVTLLRGAQGALFPVAGRHAVTVNVLWDTPDSVRSLTASTDVHISPPVDDSHRVAAMKALSTPDVLLAFAFGRDYLVEGAEVVDIALKNEVLRPHYLSVLIKESASGGVIDRNLFDQDSVLSLSEIVRIVTLLKDSPHVKVMTLAEAERIRRKIRKIGTANLDSDTLAALKAWLNRTPGLTIGSDI